MSWQVAQDYNQDSLGTEHILYSILNQRNARATVLLADMGVDIDAVGGDLESFFARQNNLEAQEIIIETEKPKRKTSILDTFGVDLTA